MASLISVLSLKTEMWHLHMNKRASMRAVGTSTICQGTREKIHPPVRWVVTQTSVRAAGLTGAYEPASIPCNHGQEHLENTDLADTHRPESLYRSPGFQRRSLSTLLSLGTLEFSSVTPFPKVTQLRASKG